MDQFFDPFYHTAAEIAVLAQCRDSSGAEMHSRVRTIDTGTADKKSSGLALRQLEYSFCCMAEGEKNAVLTCSL